MKPMNGSLAKRLIIMFCVWLAAFAGLACLVVRDAGTEGRSALTFLFSRADDAPPVAPLMAAPSPALPETVVEEAKPQPAPEWPLLPRGRQPGKGGLGKPELSADGDAFVIKLPYTGLPGQYSAFDTREKRARSIDLHGDWETEKPLPRMPLKDSGPAQFFQMAKHNGFVRISVIALPHIPALREEIRRTPTALVIRLTPAP